MSHTAPPIEAQRFGRSQTPESPRPVHIPEPANIPVLMNQMDPVFNDTATYNIPSNQNFSPYTEALVEQGLQSHSVDEHDPVQNFFREAENQATAEPIVTMSQSDVPVSTATLSEAASIFSKSDVGEKIIHDATAATNPVSQERNEDEMQDIQSKETASPILEVAPDSADPRTISNEHHTLRESANEQQKKQEQNHVNTKSAEAGDSVDYQSLLDNIAQSTSTAPTVDSLTAPTTNSSSIRTSMHSLPSVPGLPAKPPPQENPVDFPSYSYTQQFQGQHPVSTTSSDREMSQNHGLQSYAQFSTKPPDMHTNSQNVNEQSSAMNGFAQLKQPQTSYAPGQTIPGQNVDLIDIRRNQDPAERPWTPKTQAIYDQFLEDERRYVTEGIWDKFPMGSRLFVGNLPSEKVTKRDLFHTFHKYGQLAQVSIKQAYGFVQFLEASACSRALNAEQGVEIRGRKVHLEISKPQRNTKNATTGGGSTNKNQTRRRSRSPERTSRRNYNDFRDEPARSREGYRDRRSPSPRGFRTRQDFRPDPRDSRSPSLYSNNYNPQPMSAFDDDASLPIPRREARNVPDVQLLVLEPEVVQSFINWVEQAFRAKGLQASTIWLNQRLPIDAVVKRQIMEGVQAVVKLTRTEQGNSKIPLQVFDRTGGASRVKFNEYADLDIQIAADIVVQARARERGTTQPYRPQTFPPAPPQPIYQPQASYGQPQGPVQYPPPIPPPIHYAPQQSTTQPQYQYPPQQPTYRAPQQPQPTTPTQPPNLQQLLANLRQPSNQQNPQVTQTPQNGGYGVAAAQPYGYPQAPASHQQYNQFNSAQSAQGYGGGPQQPGHQQQNVQNVMEQLARYQR